MNNSHALTNDINDSEFFDNSEDELGFPINQHNSVDMKKFIPENIALSRDNVWSRLFHSEISQPRITSRSSYPSKKYGLTFPNGRTYIIPFDKRTIPIKLQKAFFAHGISFIIVNAFKSKTRPLSASRKRRHRNCRSSLNDDSRLPENISNSYPLSSEPNILYSGVDLRTTKEKIESLENEMKLLKDDSTPEEYLNALVLVQLYTSFEYGEISIENARTYLNLSKFYLDNRNLLPQAKFHILKARQILEQLNIKPTDDQIIQNLLGFDIYFLLIKCSFYAKQYSSQRDIKIKNKHILSIDTTHIDHDLFIVEEYLEKLKHLMNSNDYYEKNMNYLLIKFDIIINNLRQFDFKIKNLIINIIENIDKYSLNDKINHKIDIYLRSGFYLINFDDQIGEGLKNYKIAVELAEEQEKQEPSDIHKCQLANAVFQWGKARVKIDRLRESTERKFKRAIELYRQVNDEDDANVLKVIDELATYYTKVENFQDALNILRDSLPDKKRLFGDFSEEVIQTESRIGAIHLRECEYFDAAEHLKQCLDLQQFVYGPKDSRTCQTRDALEILKKDPTVSRTFFSRTQDGIRQDRPAFRLSNKVSHEKEDHELLLTVTKKPPIYSKN
ncbi:unnamed protein product [Rotaria sordida]|uniref:Uncharacterized protein n=1 Tax=Rotaria sordida TaxID=392033 RepID=A0A818MZX3_9BILA|nr:unnamed protein product [Rotaria sordida]